MYTPKTPVVVLCRTCTRCSRRFGFPVLLLHSSFAKKAPVPNTLSDVTKFCLFPLPYSQVTHETTWKKKTFQCHSAIPWQCEKKMFRAKWQSHRTIFRAPELRQPFNHAGSWGHKISFFDPNLSLFGYEIVRASPLALIFVDDRYVPLVAPELFLHYSRYFLLWKRDGVDSTWKMIWRGCRQPDQCSNAQWPFAGKCPCNVMQRAGSSPESLSSQRWICP